MSEILQIFASNPLSTAVGRLIDQATSPLLDGEDWGLNIQICDIINESEDEAKNAAKAIKKRLQQIEHDKDLLPKAFGLILSLIDTCVNNCDYRFHAMIMTKDLIQDLVKLIGPKNNPPIELQDRVLCLIERWAEQFKTNHDTQGVVLVFKELKAKGVMFPSRDASRDIPLDNSRPRSVTNQQQQPQFGTGISEQAGSSPRTITGEVYDKICRDLEVVETSVGVYNNIIDQFDRPDYDANTEENWLLLETLDVSCRQMKERIVELIEKVANETMTVELLRLNDELNSVFERHKELRLRKESLPVPTKITNDSPARSSSTDISSPPTFAQATSSKLAEDRSLIDFTNSEEVEDIKIGNVSNQSLAIGEKKHKHQFDSDVLDWKEADLFLQGQQQSQADDSKKTSLVDEFDALNILDTASSSKGESSNAKVTTPSDNMSDWLDAGKTDSQYSIHNQLSATREQDFVEIENWLDNKQVDSIGQQQTNTSPSNQRSPGISNFDAFIATRARVGETLPEQTTATNGKEPKVG